jgi:hypothetical protein
MEQKYEARNSLAVDARVAPRLPPSFKVASKRRIHWLFVSPFENRYSQGCSGEVDAGWYLKHVLMNIFFVSIFLRVLDASIEVGSF